MRTHFDMYCLGAAQLAKDLKWGKVHERHGISRAEWELLTSPDEWSTAERRKIRNILGEVLTASLTIAGLPAAPVMGQYIAAVIALVVAPSNRIVACFCAPDNFDAGKASGLEGPVEIVRMEPEQLQGLVAAFSAASHFDEPHPRITQVPEETEAVSKARPAKVAQK